jgi:GTP-binding protein HflX
MRSQRDKSGLPKIAIVGYTNAGKSTLLNTLTDAGILAENKLFATLDPTTRKLKLPCGETVLLTDTVGFIRKLPHHLVKAFRSTLDEAVYADILMIVIDAHDDEARAQLDVTESLLAELGAAGKPTIYVYNKCDLGISAELPSYIASNEDPNRVICAISAKSGEGIDVLLEKIEQIIHAGKSRVTFVIPNSEQAALNVLYKNATVESVEYGYEGVTVVATVDQKVRGMLKKYDVDRPDDVEEF